MNCCERVDFPIVKKCCFCVPLRKGVVIFGYVDLIISLLCLPVFIFLLVEKMTMAKIYGERPEVDPLIHVPMIIAFLILDVVTTTIMLVGAHKKKKNLLKVSCYLRVVFQVLTVFSDLLFLQYNTLLDNILYIIFIGLNLYLIFLVYNLIHQMEKERPVQYYTPHNQQAYYE